MRWIRPSGPLLSLLMMAAVGAVAEPDPMQRPPWAACEYCHGKDGRIDSPNVPATAAQSASYIVKQLADFRAGRRISPQAQMRSAVSLLDAADDEKVAQHFAAKAPLSTAGTGKHSGSLGARLYWDGGTSQLACANCHAAIGDALGNGYPVLFGLNRDYLVRQLRAFGEGRRHNDPDGVMRAQAATLSDEQIAALATYLASVKHK